LAFLDDARPASASTPAGGAESAARPVQKKLPSHESGPPESLWSEYFAQHAVSEEAVRRSVLRLTTLGEHEHVIHLIQAALINGQSQPWMYEVLADSMTFAGRPEEEVQRVVLSLTDFGSANLESMMISGAYLTRFGRDEAALRMYRQAARIAPQRPEPYVMGLRLARKLKQPEDVIWSAPGILEHAWTDDYEQLHREAENAALEAVVPALELEAHLLARDPRSAIARAEASSIAPPSRRSTTTKSSSGILGEAKLGSEKSLCVRSPL